MKISHFCWGLELKGAVNFLAIYGMVMSVIGALFAAFLFFLPPLLSMNSFIGIYTGATVLLLVKFGWFAYSFLLYQKNTADDFTGVKKMIKIGSYIIGSVQAGIFALVLIFGIILIAFGRGYKVMGCIMIPIGIFFLIFPSLLLDGIRKKHSGKVKDWIIFKNGIFGLILSLCVVKLFYTVNFVFYILQIIAFTLEFMYCSGMVIVHYNILLDDENILESALENYSKDGKNMDFQNKMTNYPPPYSKIV